MGIEVFGPKVENIPTIYNACFQSCCCGSLHYYKLHIVPLFCESLMLMHAIQFNMHDLLLISKSFLSFMFAAKIQATLE